MHTVASEHAISRLWHRLPILIRAIVLGFTVSTLGVGTWVLSLSLIPAPWSIVFMAVALWVYWHYFSGHWGPQTTQQSRRRWFREKRLSPAVWKWGLLASFIFVVILNSGLVVTFRIIEFPAEAFKAEYNLDALPRWMAWIFLIMASCVAGICEEVGFRGYMQAPLEKRYGPVVGISIVSIVFVVVHLHQAWAAPILFHIFAASALFGALAYASGSLIPGIVAHISIDVINFSYWWSDIAGAFEYDIIATTGVDQHFILSLSTLITSLGLFLLIIRKLVTLRKSIESTGQ